MKKPPIPLKLKGVMLISAIIFVSTSMTVALSAPSLLLIGGPGAETSAQLLTMLTLAGLSALPIYSAITFARILVRRSVMAARVYLMVLVGVQMVAIVSAWEGLNLETAWSLIWPCAVAWLFFSLAPPAVSPVDTP